METETERSGKTKNEAVRPKKWILEALTSLALKKLSRADSNQSARFKLH